MNPLTRAFTSVCSSGSGISLGSCGILASIAPVPGDSSPRGRLSLMERLRIQSSSSVGARSGSGETPDASVRNAASPACAGMGLGPFGLLAQLAKNAAASNTEAIKANRTSNPTGRLPSRCFGTIGIILLTPVSSPRALFRQEFVHPSKAYDGNRDRCGDLASVSLL